MKRLCFLLIFVGLLAFSVQAQTNPTTQGTWTPFLNYIHNAVYNTAVQPPVNAGGNSVFAKRGVIPIKFTLASGLGPLVIKSDEQWSTTSTKYAGGIKFSPASALTLNTLTTLEFTGTISGPCGGGSPRFQINYPGGNIWVYFGTLPNFNDDPCATFASGFDVMGATDARFDTSAVGGTFYDTLSNARALVGNQLIESIYLVVDGFWTNQQAKWVTVNTVTVNDNTYTAQQEMSPTCELPSATIAIFRNGTSPGDQPTEADYMLPADNGNNFRVGDCQYIYNINTKNLGTGLFTVYANVNNDGNVTNSPATFTIQ